MFDVNRLTDIDILCSFDRPCSMVRINIFLNHFRRVNKALECINGSQQAGGMLQVRAQSNGQRIRRLKRKYNFPLGFFIHMADFVGHRVLSKLGFTKRWYFAVTGGLNRPLAYSEILGRIISCGYEILDVDYGEEEMVVSARKWAEPQFNMEASYGPLIRLNRIGEGGRIIKVYKFRTMHPYSEYAQEYLFKQQGLAKSGKLKHDYRVTAWGRWMRKFWIDELPMLVNWAKGELKLVGVRPLSPHYLSLYPEEVQQERLRHKPGLVPPYYVDLPNGFEEVVRSELHYMNLYRKQPLLTDLRYFFKAIWNILFLKARSN